MTSTSWYRRAGPIDDMIDQDVHDMARALEDMQRSQQNNDGPAYGEALGRLNDASKRFRTDRAVQEIQSALAQLEQAQRDGHGAAYGRALQRIDDARKAFNAATGRGTPNDGGSNQHIVPLPLAPTEPNIVFPQGPTEPPHIDLIDNNHPPEDNGPDIQT